jgi:hypothetical protein
MPYHIGLEHPHNSNAVLSCTHRTAMLSMMPADPLAGACACRTLGHAWCTTHTGPRSTTQCRSCLSHQPVCSTDCTYSARLGASHRASALLVGQKERRDDQTRRHSVCAKTPFDAATKADVSSTAVAMQAPLCRQMPASPGPITMPLDMGPHHRDCPRPAGQALAPATPFAGGCAVWHPLSLAWALCAALQTQVQIQRPAQGRPAAIVGGVVLRLLAWLPALALAPAATPALPGTWWLTKVGVGSQALVCC